MQAALRVERCPELKAGALTRNTRPIMMRILGPLISTIRQCHPWDRSGSVQRPTFDDPLPGPALKRPLSLGTGAEVTAARGMV